MRKIYLVFSLTSILMVGQASSAFGAATVKYTNQKSGAVCSAAQLNKTVTLPTKKILICQVKGKKRIWQELVVPKASNTSRGTQVVPFGTWGETNFAKFMIEKTFTLDSVGVNTSSGPGDVFLVKQCLQTWQPPNPVAGNMNMSNWSAIDSLGNRMTASTIFGPKELDPTFPSTYSDLYLQPGACVSGHLVFFTKGKVVQLNYSDNLFGGELKFSAN